MNCEQAAEFVSALFDGEQIPQEAATHICGCTSCGARMQDYALMSAELRRSASGASTERIPEGRWKIASPVVASWLTKWRETMRIPRFAFALMLATILVLSGGLALVRARDGGRRQLVVLSLKASPKSQEMRCLIRTDQEDFTCNMATEEIPGTLVASVRFIRRDAQRVKLGMKTKFYIPGAPGPQRNIPEILAELPEKELWLNAGESAKVSVSGLGDVEVTAEFTERDSMTALVPKEPLEPAPDEFRLISPVLVQGNLVLANLAGISAMGRVLGPENGHAYMIYAPDFGRVVLSPVPFEGAIEGKIEGSYISFAKDGKSYLLLTGAPIAVTERIWLLCQPGWRPSPPPFELADDKPSIVSERLERLLGNEKQPKTPEHR